jgi:hypothetical protein
LTIPAVAECPVHEADDEASHQGGEVWGDLKIQVNTSIVDLLNFTWSRYPSAWSARDRSGSTRIMWGGDGSGQVRTGRNRWGQVGSGRVGSGQVGTGRDRSGQVGTGRDRSGQVGTGRDRSGQVGTGQDRSGQT